MVLFRNRRDAGKQLAQLLKKYKDKEAVIYALPRGGAVVAAEIAAELHAPLDLILAHKIGHPYQPEYAIAAISESGHMVGSSHELASIDRKWLEREKQQQMQEIKRKRQLYLKGKKEILLENKIAIIVDDGIATGLTMQAGILELKDRHPSKIVAAIPVAPKSTADLLKTQVDELAAIEIPDDYSFLGAVGAYYREFGQTEDEEVIAILDTFAKDEDKMEKLIRIAQPETILEGMLKIPKKARGIVLFAHGSGSSRFSPRNNFVADVLNKAELGTLLIDLLSRQEDEIYQTRFDIGLLSERLAAVVKWLKEEPETRDLPLGLFGSSTGAAAALHVAASLGNEIKAVVSRGGRPDLAMPVLDRVSAPTLFIVGGDDFGVIELNQEAYARLACLKKFEIVPHATHLFEEPGCLEEVAQLSKDWFKKYLGTQIH